MPNEIFIQTNSAGTSLLERAVILLQDIGFYQIIIPFVLVFAVVFAILEKSKLLGEDNRQVNSIVALAIALTTTGAVAVTGVISRMIPLVILAIMVILLFFLIYGLFGGEITNIPNGLKVGLGIAGGIAVAVIFLFSANFLQFITGEVFGMVLLIAIVITVISVIVGASKNQN